MLHSCWSTNSFRRIVKGHVIRNMTSAWMICIKLSSRPELPPLSMPGITRRIMITQMSLHSYLFSSLCLNHTTILPQFNMFLNLRYRSLLDASPTRSPMHITI
jgi:hypothetical protein